MSQRRHALGHSSSCHLLSLSLTENRVMVLNAPDDGVRSPACNSSFSTRETAAAPFSPLSSILSLAFPLFVGMTQTAEPLNSDQLLPQTEEGQSEDEREKKVVCVTVIVPARYRVERMFLRVLASPYENKT